MEKWKLLYYNGVYIGVILSKVFFLVVEPSKIIFLIQSTIPQKKDIILLYIGHHSIPKLNATQV